MRFLLFALSFSVALCGAADEWKDTSPHRSAIVEANGVRIHYLDWGGPGQPIVFLAGLGNTAHVFDTLAPKFTARNFRAIGMTRRGFGQSDRPESGYDVATRAADLAGFLDAMKIERAILIGHSLAGDEMAAFALAHPARVIKLVYLDAAYDRTALNPKVGDLESALMAAFAAKAPKLPPYATPLETDIARGKARFGAMWNESLEAEVRENYEVTADGTLKRRATPPFEALRKGSRATKLDYLKIEAPALMFFSVDNRFDEIPAEKRESVQPAIRSFWEEQHRRIAELRKNPHSQVIPLQGANHYCWFDRGDEVFAATMKFLAARP